MSQQSPQPTENKYVVTIHGSVIDSSLRMQSISQDTITATTRTRTNNNSTLDNSIQNGIPSSAAQTVTHAIGDNDTNIENDKLSMAEKSELKKKLISNEKKKENKRDVNVVSKKTETENNGEMKIENDDNTIKNSNNNHNNMTELLRVVSQVISNISQMNAKQANTVAPTVRIILNPVTVKSTSYVSFFFCLCSVQDIVSYQMLHGCVFFCLYSFY